MQTIARSTDVEGRAQSWPAARPSCPINSGLVEAKAAVCSPAVSVAHLNYFLF
jgi:hypothetical protein